MNRGQKWGKILWVDVHSHVGITFHFLSERQGYNCLNNGTKWYIFPVQIKDMSRNIFLDCHVTLCLGPKRNTPFFKRNTYLLFPYTLQLDSNFMADSWMFTVRPRRQHPKRHQLYSHLPPITKTIQVRWTRHAGHWWRSRDELISDVILWTPDMAVLKRDDQQEHTFINYERIRDVVRKTCLRRWTIGKSGERGSGISVLPARHDDDDDERYLKNASYSWHKCCIYSSR